MLLRSQNHLPSSFGIHLQGRAEQVVGPSCTKKQLAKTLVARKNERREKNNRITKNDETLILFNEAEIWDTLFFNPNLILNCLRGMSILR
ncbi:hypothetical protein A2982_01960 [candidate division WWE3 bacterium RIFCSPLOWO2_01_FULL_39_13]|uniref:Uncharacterized protein n=1 Tax=candidate division WWE3 bacterium RIFCSPLOWO2_01_FULL_39_13 TaxID=1802624 RepID=A0A1F4V543_UNCKA|nr:MAG: hypothetical protein A2982_01960 [candidate division WWE3 bacterium RIFCSPLOWO2_01_FULL_39_13]